MTAPKTIQVTGQQLVDAFHVFVFDYASPWVCGSWRGVPILKSPTDLMVMQELVQRVKPDFIIETGTRLGGSTLFWADMCHLRNKGCVISIDNDPKPVQPRPEHRRIKYLLGDCLSPVIIRRVKQIVGNSKAVMVDLDSNHQYSHVLKEMELYSQFVTKDSYMIVEDTDLNGHPVDAKFGPGPWEAVQEWLPQHPEFIQDRACEGYAITFHPGGWLKRIC